MGGVTGGLDLGGLGRPARLSRCVASLYEGPVQPLIDELGRLPGIGPKSAQRIAFYLLKVAPEDASRLAGAIIEAKEKFTWCRRCFNIAEGELCAFCRDERRDRDGALRRRGAARHRRRRAHARVPRPVPRAAGRDLADRGHRPRAAAHQGAARTRVDDEGVTEVILATNPNIEGEATAMYLARLLKPLGSGSPASRAASRSAATSSTPTRSPSAAPSRAAATSTPDRTANRSSACRTRTRMQAPTCVRRVGSPQSTSARALRMTVPTARSR